MAYNLRSRQPQQQKSTKQNDDAAPTSHPSSTKDSTSQDLGVFHLRHLLAVLIMYRWLNTFLVQTFYVPDEYWQSVEVAHNMVYGYGHLTWEWRNGLRGYTYPAIFAAIHKTLSLLRLDFGPVLIVTPRLLQAAFSAIGDLYVFCFTRRLVGVQGAPWALLCQCTSCFIFYIATRTLTNTMETTLITIALYYYPWPQDMIAKDQPKNILHGTRLYFLFASLSCIIRPTAGIVCVPLVLWHIARTPNKVQTVIRDYLPIGLFALAWSVGIDRIFYGKWVFVPYNFLHFNVVNDIGAFYGSHPFHWYITAGIPVVMATHMLPFLLGVKVAWRRLKPLLILMAWIIFVYSCLSHKEFRFILPILPFTMCLCGAFFQLVHGSRRATLTLIFLVMTNLPVAMYLGMVHQRGTLDVMMHLQMSHLKQETKAPSVFFLMPCHSTPYYSHVHQNITMRFLTCEPNLNNDLNYEEEAEVFYDNPNRWLQREYGSKTQQPDYFVIFDLLEPEIIDFLSRHRYTKVAGFFHTHFPSDRVGSSILVYSKIHMPPIHAPENGLHNGRLRGM